MPMELRTLRYFVTLAEELHFGRAAGRLAITQPPLSLAIRGLENELGVMLFARTRRRVALTHAGATFLEQARAILARASEAVLLAQAAGRGEVGRLSIGYMSASIFTLLPAVLREFAARHPGVRLDLREVTLPQQMAALREGTLHAGFVRPPVTDAELTAETLLEEPLLVALPVGHPLAAARRVRLARLANEAFVTFQRAPGLVLHDLVLGFCLQHGLSPRVTQQASQTHAVVGLVAAGIGVALVPASAQEIRLRGVTFRPLAERSPPVGTCLAWRRDDASPVLKAFVATARRVAARRGVAKTARP
jgi:DNA-binding transcriptional LysR family regulator